MTKSVRYEAMWSLIRSGDYSVMKFCRTAAGETIQNVGKFETWNDALAAAKQFNAGVLTKKDIRAKIKEHRSAITLLMTKPRPSKAQINQHTVAILGLKDALAA
jgi:hypothetical protein